MSILPTTCYATLLILSIDKYLLTRSAVGEKMGDGKDGDKTEDKKVWGGLASIG